MSRTPVVLSSVAVLVFLWSSAASWPSARALAGDDSRPAQVDHLFEPWTQPDSPGCVCAVMQDGETIFGRAYGMASLEHGVPLTPDSVLMVASMAKQFTAASIGLLALRGQISLDDDIRRYVPELANFGEEVTIRHLLHHTSGVRDYLALRSLTDRRTDESFDNEEMLRLLYRQRELNFRPGEHFLYSNSGYLLLAEVVHRVSGQPLAEFASESLFAPLDMLATRFDDDVTRVIPHRASSYGPIAEGGFRRYLKAYEVVGAGNLLTTVVDLGRWDDNFYRPKVGGRALIEMLYERGRLNDGRQLTYAMGLIHGTYRGLPTVRHDGFNEGFRAELLRFPEQRTAVSVLCNLETIDPERLAESVADIFLADALYEPKELQAEETVVLSPQSLTDLTGFYWSGEINSVRQVVLRQDRLYWHRGSGRESALAPIGERRFLLVGVPTRVEMRFPSAASDGERRVLVETPFSHGVWHGFEPTIPSSESLAEYAGSYFSAELDVTYEILHRDRELWVRSPEGERQLEPLYKDGFQTESVMTCRFQRNAAGEIVAMLMDRHRLRNLRFDRVPESR